MSIISENPGENTIGMNDFVKLLHPSGERVWRKIQLVREKKKKQKIPLGDRRPKNTPKDLSEKDYLVEEQKNFYKELDAGTWWNETDVDKSLLETEQLHIQNLSGVKRLFKKGQYADDGPDAKKNNKLTGKKKAVYNLGAKHGFLLENSYSIRTQFCRGVDPVGGEWKLMIIDDDDPDPARSARAREKFANEWKLPYVETSGGTHYYVRIAGCPRVTGTEEMVFSSFIGDLFGSSVNGNNVWENNRRVVRNFPDDGMIPLYPFEKLTDDLGKKFYTGIVPEDMTDQMREFQKEAGQAMEKPKSVEKQQKENPKTKKVKKKVKKEVDGESVEEVVEVEVPMSKKDLLMKRKVQLDSKKVSRKAYIPKKEELLKLLKCIDPNLPRGDWVVVCCAVKGFGEHFYDVFDEWSEFQYVPEEYFEFLEESDMTKEEWIKKESKYDFDTVFDLWHNGGLNREGYDRVIGWRGLKAKVKKWYPETYAKYFEAVWEETVNRQISLGDRQMISIFESLLDTTIDRTDDSDFLSEDNGVVKSYHKFSESGYWEEFVSGKAEVIDLSFKTIVDKIVYPKIMEVQRMHPELSMSEKDPLYVEWIKKAENKFTKKKHSNYKIVHDKFSTISTANIMAEIIHGCSMNNTRFRTMDSNAKHGGGSRYLFPFSDFVAELLTGEVRAPERTDMLSVHCGYPYPTHLVDDEGLPSDKCKEIWEEMDEYMSSMLCYRLGEGLEMDEARKHDPPVKRDEQMSIDLDRDIPEAVAWTLRECARSMLGYNAWNHVNWMTGSGGNGKTQFIKFLRRVFGTLSGGLSNSFWTSVQDGDKADSSLESVVKKRISFSEELRVDNGQRFEGSKLKSLSGEGSVTVRKLHENSYELEPHCSTWVAMNQIPEFDAADPAMRRRIRRLIFPWAFGDANVEKSNYSKGITAYNVDVKLGTDEWRDAFVLRLLYTMKKDLVVDGELPVNPPYPEPAAVKEATNLAFRDAGGFGAEFLEWAYEKISITDKHYKGLKVTKAENESLFNEFCGKMDDESGEPYKTPAERKKTAPTKAKIHTLMTNELSVVYSVGEKAYKGYMIRDPRAKRTHGYVKPCVVDDDSD